MKLLQINIVANISSTGRIAEGIGLVAQRAGMESWVAYGRAANPSASHLIRIGTAFDVCEHGIETRLFDNHGLASRRATSAFLKKVEEIGPDIVLLHNIHGFYLNYKILFRYLREKRIPVVWTFHDCWPFTGHCAYFELSGCDKWKTGCGACPRKGSYPASRFLDRSRKNYRDKKRCFTSIADLTIVPVSNWLDGLVGQSFMKDFPRVVIHNGIDTDAFSPSSEADRRATRERLGIREDETMLLGVAGDWDERKGLRDFVELDGRLSPKRKIVLVGLDRRRIAGLPPGMIGLGRTESTGELAKLYSAADLFLNLTCEDNYPTTNLEAISCGTPCLTYRTGGSPESVCPETGYVVGKGDIASVLEIVERLPEKNVAELRKRAVGSFKQESCFERYVSLFEEICKRRGAPANGAAR